MRIPGAAIRLGRQVRRLACSHLQAILANFAYFPAVMRFLPKLLPLVQRTLIQRPDNAVLTL